MKSITKAALATAFSMVTFSMAAFSGAALAQDAAPVVPGSAEAAGDHCGFASDEAFGDYLGQYRTNIQASAQQAGVTLSAEDTNPYAARFTSLYVFKDAAAYRQTMHGYVDLEALDHQAVQVPGNFSQCQAIDASAKAHVPVIAIDTRDGRLNGAVFAAPGLD